MSSGSRTITTGSNSGKLENFQENTFLIFFGFSLWLAIDATSFQSSCPIPCRVQPPSPGHLPLAQGKIRKDTTSCWECKSRKQRCRLALNQSRGCVSCQRRGKSCVMQQFDDPCHDHVAPDQIFPLTSEAILDSLHLDSTRDPIPHESIPPVAAASSEDNRNPEAGRQFLDSALVDSSENLINVDTDALAELAPIAVDIFST
ncbi:hypothetical protein F4808DRAFT_391767 [Astrocystis sublimbata]|nr:hypothetical protein F4808DRAFT_391767 [Astrocystis sublimbata]